MAIKVPLDTPGVPGPFDRARLSVASMGVSHAAIARAYTHPSKVRETTLLRLQKAAAELGLPAPGVSEKGGSKNGARARAKATSTRAGRKG